MASASGYGVSGGRWHKGLDNWLDGFAGVGGDAWGSWIDNLTGGGSAHKVEDGATGGGATRGGDEQANVKRLRRGVYFLRYRFVNARAAYGLSAKHTRKGDDIAAWMLTNGWAIVYRGERGEGILKRAYYWALEAMARAASRGIYTSHFTPPHKYRK